MENQSLPFKIIATPTLAIVSVSLLLAVIPEVPMHTISTVAQNITQNEGNTGAQILHIVKDTTNSYTISSGASFIGAFDTTYSIIGSVGSMKAYKDLIISTIIDDFGNSPTVGYVNNSIIPSASQTNLTQPSLPNPFATKDAIDEKIRSEITSSIDNAPKSKPVEGEIKCIFGSSLNDFKCSFHR
jgi:hypothetical protein